MPDSREVKDKKETCSYCGKWGHSRRAPTKIRRKECPTFDQKCTYCGRDHHLSSMCRSKDKPKHNEASAATLEESQSAIFDALCSITVLGNQ